MNIFRQVPGALAKGSIYILSGMSRRFEFNNKNNNKNGQLCKSKIKSSKRLK